MPVDRTSPAHGGLFVASDGPTSGVQGVDLRTVPGPERRRLASVMDDRSAIAGFSRVSVAMVLTDARAEDNPIVYVNDAFERTSGYARSAVIGRNCRFLQGEDTKKSDVDRLRHSIAAGQDVTVDIQNYRADGRPFLNRLVIAPILDNEGEVLYFLGIQKEVYESEREENAAEALLQTVQDRVQEDLSLLLKGLGEVGDDPGSLAFEAVTRRLECLQLVYESLQLSDSLTDRVHGIDLGSLLSRVAVGVAHHEGRSGVRYIQSIEPLEVNLESAIRIGLLMSEVLDNAFRHAFQSLDEGLVELRVTRLAAGGLRVMISDDGLGLPLGAKFPDPITGGGRLIGLLTEGLDATLTPICGAAGTVVMIDVPVGVTDI